MTRRRRLQVVQVAGGLLLAAGLMLGIWEAAVCGLTVIVLAAILKRRHT